MYLHVGRLEFLVCLFLPVSARGILCLRSLLWQHQSEVYHALVPILAHLVPSAVILPLVLGYVGRLGVEGPMWSIVCDIEEEGFFSLGETVYVVDGALGDEVRGVEVRRNGIRIQSLLVVYERERVEVVDNSPDGAYVVVEASVAWIGVQRGERTVVERVLMREPLHLVGIVAYTLCQGQVPLAAHGTTVAGGLQGFGYRHAVLGQAESHARDAAGVWVASRKQLRTRGA